jgi:hypothetical protein
LEDGETKEMVTLKVGNIMEMIKADQIGHEVIKFCTTKEEDNTISKCNCSTQRKRHNSVNNDE